MKKKNDIFSPAEKKILKFLIKGEKLSINKIADKINENRQKTSKYLKELKRRRWIEEI